jgi:hypothetical protein
MFAAVLFDAGLAQRLPLPLAQLYRRAHNAKTAAERHLTAFALWEAALKLLATGLVVEYAPHGQHDPKLAEALQRLARPSLGDWLQIVRRLLPILAEGGDPGFRGLRDLLLGKVRADLPRAKENSTGAAGGLLEKAYHFFQFNQEEYVARYHKRSNVESTSSAIKRKFGDLVMSKTDAAMANEVLCKILCYHLTCLIQELETLGIAPVFWQDEEEDDGAEPPAILRMAPPGVSRWAGEGSEAGRD